MRSFLDTFRGWLVPIALIVIATLLTVPWSYWVVKSVYDRDIFDNAVNIARRVEIGVRMAPRDSARAEVVKSLGTELATDNAVSVASFYVLGNSVPQSIRWIRQTDASRIVRPTGLAADEFPLREDKTVIEQYGDFYTVSVPWKDNGHTIGITYLELSRQELNYEFWQKEGPLVKRVVGLTAAAILVLSCVGIYAYGTRLRIQSERQRAELAQAGMLAERGLTAAVLAHEIRNPLAALRFQLHSLRKNKIDEERVQTTADTIDSELSRIQQLVTDYLEHEKARSMRVQPVDLKDSARSLQKLMEELLNQTRTAFTVDAPPDPVMVTCDPHALRQILMNLVLNAQQAMGDGGRIMLRVGREDTFGTLDVSDTGPGIPPEIRERLFKPFQTTKAEGHGIGLALVKRFVDNFGGNVSVDSNPGTGTTFRLRLPLASANPLPQPIPAPASPASTTASQAT
jgi:signal transduction histidine kinase